MRGESCFLSCARRGVQVSVIGMGGSHLGQAIDRGITFFFDNAWDYNEGRSEERDTVQMPYRYYGRSLPQLHAEKRLSTKRVFSMAQPPLSERAGRSRYLERPYRQSM